MKATHNEMVGASVRMRHVDDDGTEHWEAVIEGRSFAICVTTTLAKESRNPDEYVRLEREQAMLTLRRHLDKHAPMAGPHPACGMCGTPARFHAYVPFAERFEREFDEDVWQGRFSDKDVRRFLEMRVSGSTWCCIRHRYDAARSIHVAHGEAPLVREHGSVPIEAAR